MRRSACRARRRPCCSRSTSRGRWVRPTSRRRGSPPRRPRPTDFVELVPKSFRIGVVSFSTRAQLALAPTEDRDLVHQALGDAAPGRGHSDRRRGAALGSARPTAEGEGRVDAADDGPADLRRRSGRRLDHAKGGCAAGAATAGARVHDLARHAGRDGGARAPGRIRRDDPRAAEPADAADDRAHDRRAVLHGGDRQGARERLRQPRLAARPHEDVARDHRPVRRRRGCPALLGMAVGATWFRRVA